MRPAGTGPASQPLHRRGNGWPIGPQWCARPGTALLHGERPTVIDEAPASRGRPVGVSRRYGAVVQLIRAIAIGEANGPVAGLASLATVDPGLLRHTPASAYLHEKAGDILTAARLYADAARSSPNLAERHHLTRQAARINQALRG